MPGKGTCWIKPRDAEKRRAEEALRLALPTIDRVLDRLGKTDLYVCVLIKIDEDPGLMHLAQISMGRVNKWEYQYDEIARAKARLSARTGMNSREVLLLHPELLQPGDIKWWGSVVNSSIIVAASGLESWEDEAICKVVSALYSMLNETEIENNRSQEGYYLT